VEKTDLSKYDNSWYHPGKKVVCIVWYFVNVLFFISHIIPLSGLKIWLLQLFGAKVGCGVVIKPGVNIKYPWKLVIGDYSWIGEDVWIDNLAQVTIGSNVCISQGAMLLTGNHNYKKSTFDLDVGDILLEDGVWIGAFSIVCPGVKCQSHAVLSVNSVATKKLEPYTIYQGNPARKVRKRVIK
jgi:putative colanic acid biosynthesis acetyltransferase WcaF